MKKRLSNKIIYTLILSAAILPIQTTFGEQGVVNNLNDLYMELNSSANAPKKIVMPITKPISNVKVISHTGSSLVEFIPENSKPVTAEPVKTIQPVQSVQTVKTEPKTSPKSVDSQVKISENVQPDLNTSAKTEVKPLPAAEAAKTEGQPLKQQAEPKIESKVEQKPEQKTEPQAAPYVATVEDSDNNSQNINKDETSAQNETKKQHFNLNPFKKKTNKTTEVESNQATENSEAFTPLEAEEQTEVKNKTSKKKNIQKKSKNTNKNQRVINNNLYLDKYQTKPKKEFDSFYKEKNISVDKKGNLELMMNEDERSVGKLIEEIEMSNPNDTFTPPVSLTMKECIGIALAKRPDILSAQKSTDIAKDRIMLAWSAYLPTNIGFNMSRTWVKNEGSPSYHYNNALLPTISANMLLFDFGKNKVNVDIAKTDYESSKYDLESSINSVIYYVKSAYYNLLFAQKQVDVYKNTIEDYELQLKVAKKYFEIGKKPQIDVTIADFNLGNARLNMVKAVNTLEVARVTLANTLGLPEFANFTLVDEFPDIEYNLSLDTMLKDAFSTRPDLLSYERSVRASYLNVRGARREFLPDITANGAYGRNGTFHDDFANSIRAGISLDYGINFFQTAKQYSIAKKSYEKALADYENVRQQVYMEVKEAHINLNSSRNTVEQSKMNVEQAKLQLYHANGRYNAGIGDAIELKDSENTYLNSQLEYYQALLDYNTEAANIERIVGCPIESLNNKTYSINEEITK